MRARVRFWRRALALALIALGGLLLAGQLGLLAPVWPLLAAGLGLLCLAAALLQPAAALPPFAFERGSVEAAELWLSAALADVRLGAFVGSSQLAVGEFSAQRGPRLQVRAGRAHLRLDGRSAEPFFFGDWSAQLAKGLPWTLEARLGLGQASFNLRDLNVASARLRLWAGDLDLSLPAQGPGEWDLRLTLGSLRLQAQEGAAVSVRLQAGRLTRVRLDEARWAPAGPGQWASLGAAPTAPAVQVRVRLGAGDLELA